MTSPIRQRTERKLVLVVEDNHLNLTLLRTLLQSEGYEVLEAVTAHDGLDAARRLRPDVIVMDVRLPDMSGFDATRILKTEATTAKIPVVITSAYGGYIDKKRLQDCGCDHYVPAPINVSGFVALIGSLIQSGPTNHKGA